MLVTVSAMRSGTGEGLGTGGNDAMLPAAVEPAADRRTLARWMLGRWEASDADEADAARLQALLELAWRDGVAALLGHSLENVPGVPEALHLPLRELRRERAMGALARRGRLRAVLQRLQVAGIPVLVLKGTALAEWLYPAPYLRESSDVDLLFASQEDALRAAAVLESLGHAVPGTPTRFRHEVSSRSADGKLDLDLHWALSGWPVLDRLPGFDALSAAGIALPELGNGARGLGPAHALLHACVHRASNLAADIGDRLKWLYDLHLLAARLDADDGWNGLVEACRQAQACGVCAEGLAASTELFATVVPPEVERALAAGRVDEPLDARRLADWRYVQRRNFAALNGWGDRLAWLGRRLLPTESHMRELYGHEQGRLGLLWQRTCRAGQRVFKG